MTDRMYPPNFRQDVFDKTKHIVKFVIGCDHDYEQTKAFLDEHNYLLDWGRVYVQPVILLEEGRKDFSVAEQLSVQGKWLAEKVLEDKLFGSRLGVQCHKLFWGNKRRR